MLCRHPRSFRGAGVANSSGVSLRFRGGQVHPSLRTGFRKLLLADRAFLTVADSLYPVLPDIGRRRKFTGDSIFIGWVVVRIVVQEQASLIPTDKFARFHGTPPERKPLSGAHLAPPIADRRSPDAAAGLVAINRPSGVSGSRRRSSVSWRQAAPIRAMRRYERVHDPGHGPRHHTNRLSRRRTTATTQCLGDCRRRPSPCRTSSTP